MRILKLNIGCVLVLTIVGAFYRISLPRHTPSIAQRISGTVAATKTEAASTSSTPSTESYRLEASQSKFIAHAHRGGLLWFKGHDHLIAIREFTGEAQLDPALMGNSSLRIIAKTASLEETSSVFTDAQKKIINKELHDIVFLPDQYPEISLKSTSVNGEARGPNQYELKIAGELTLNGVTRQIKIPARVTVSGNELRAQGEFSIHRSDYKVKATSAVHGLIRVRDRVDFTFDIIGRR
jgi:polyisoprenoid-binding protein YceI